MLQNQNDWSRWVVISSVSRIGSPSFSFPGGIRKKANNKTWMSEIFFKGHILSTAGDPLSASKLRFTWVSHMI